MNGGVWWQESVRGDKGAEWRWNAQLNTPGNGSMSSLTDFKVACATPRHVNDVVLNGRAISDVSDYLTSISDLPAIYRLAILNVHMLRITRPLHQLTDLIVRGCMLQTFPFVIHNLIFLQSLDLSHNNLFVPDLPTLNTLRNLRTLNLSYNRLADLRHSGFHLRQLTTLILSHNNLQVLPPLYDALPNLETLDISHNVISTLTDDILLLQKLKILKVEGLLNLVAPPHTVCCLGMDAIRQFFIRKQKAKWFRSIN